MEALKYFKTIENDGEIKLTGIPCKRGQQVEMIILIESKKTTKNKPEKKRFKAIKIKTRGFKFDRSLANER